MKKLLIIWFLAVVGVVFVMGCTQERSKFPEKIGDYSILKVKDMSQLLSKEKGMESFTHVTYSGYQGWAFVNLILYKSEEAARVDYNAGGEQGYKGSEIGGLKGMYKTSFSYNTFNITFGWNEGRTNKFINIAKQKQADENIEDIKKQCRRGLLLFIEAFKEL
ncbi:hypothetical protein ES707_15657 [subsurface metagenome]